MNGELSDKKAVLGIAISTGPFQDQVKAIMAAAREHRSGYVCCVNAHMTVEAHRDKGFAAVVNNADLATPDGMPVLFALRRTHRWQQERVAGNDLMPGLLAQAEHDAVGVFFFGGSEVTLQKIRARIQREHPNLKVSGAISPPFRQLSKSEMSAAADAITASGAGLVMVSLGCPKQEKWMAAMKDRIPATMVGLGGAFLLYAGTDSRAPKWMRDIGLEWAYRLALEPGRLWRRYLVTNTWFLLLLIGAIIFPKRNAVR